MSEMTLERKRLLHFFTDEKVVNDAIESFETAYHNENLFLVLSKDGSPTLVKPHKNTLFLRYKSLELKEIVKQSNSFGEIIFHSMDYQFSHIIQKMNHPNITWIIWGADMYGPLLYRKGYQLYTDEKALYKVRARKMPVFLYKALTALRDYVLYRAQIKINGKINSVSAYATDYNLLVKYYPEFYKCQNKFFFYYPIEKMLDDQIIDRYVSGDNIWVNNAAGYNGNHIAVLKKLSHFKHLKTVSAPLSYGIPYWAKYVEEEGKKILGDHFFPIMTFLPKFEYYKLFLSSNAFVFGHLRQCAVGNIIIALYLGAKVFLFKANPLYDFYKSLGVTIYNIDEELTEENAYTPMSDDLRRKNRQIMIDNYSAQKQIALIKNNF